MLKEGVFLGKRYEILGRVGSGGMADVYKGKDHKLNRYVAIKVLKSDYRTDEVFIQKFLSEAQAAAGLMHPNVVNVYDVGQDRGLYYMVMELVEGITLKEYIEKKGKLTAKETISISIQMVTGIQAAHNQHIIHRDIKPQNIIISKEGKVKVTDFGIARATTSTKTISSSVMGSVHYTSPEQARGSVVDEKSDIYSAGITMYEMVTGHVPFDGDSTVSVAIKHLQEEIVSPAVEVPDIPYSLEQIIMKCTQKNPDRRYPDCGALILDLKRSLVSPEGDFVHLSPYASNLDETVVMPTEEMERFQDRGYDDGEYDDGYGDEYDEGYDDGYDDEYDEGYDDGYGDEYDEGYDDGYGDEYDDGYDDENDYDYDDDDEDYEGDYDDGYGSGRGRKSDVDPNTKKIMKILMIVAAVIIAFIVLFLVGKAAGLFKKGPGVTATQTQTQVKVPNVVGMTKDEAADVLSKKNLGIKVSKQMPSDEYEKGLIISQDPGKDSKVDKNTEVKVIISSGKAVKETTVPNVAGMSEEDAQKTLEDSKLTVDYKSEFSDTVEEGKVISTDPAAGTTVKEGSKVTMVVSKGAEKIAVPKLVDLSREDADAALTGAGLKTGNVTEEYSDEYEAGIVMSQKTAEGKKVKKGTSVDYVVSKGPKIEMATVPRLVGTPEEEAKQKITDSGLQVGNITYENNDVMPGYVIYQSAPIGSEMEKGSFIDFVVSLGPEEAPPTPDNPDDGSDPGTDPSGNTEG